MLKHDQCVMWDDMPYVTGRLLAAVQRSMPNFVRLCR